ncbi:hypothetical protein OPQ81_000643 [Rhizoctonia solani]|nr:hypothetical protein OPQ81_000643 [Rhizoctonia solani]
MASTIQILRLPPEIIILIAECLGDDVSSISNFYKTSMVIRQTLCSQCYRFRSNELGHIRSLQIGLTWSACTVSYKLPSDLVPLLRSTLKEMPRLVVLSLSVTPGALDELLEGFDPPFRLIEFVHSGKLSSTVAQFLKTQSSITKLGWLSVFSQEQSGYLLSLLEDSLFLPALSELAGSLRLLSAVIPRRSITKIRLMYHTLAFIRLENSMAAFSCPMGQISSLCIVEYRPTWQSWTAFITKLETTCVRCTLKEVHIVEAFTGPGPLSWRNELRAHVSRLACFKSLEHLEISRSPGVNVSIQALYERLKYYGMDSILSWKIIVPSLTSVTVYDYQLC